MLFTSIEFVFFILLLLPVYYTVEESKRWPILLSASYFFYGLWNLSFLPLLLCSTLIDYFAGLYLEKDRPFKKRKIVLLLSLAVNFSFLVYFKYWVFLWNSLAYFFVGMKPFPEEYSFLLPLGISFYTFQTVGYTLDVYWRRRNAERHLGYFALFVVYFPQLIAGPIENSKKLISEFRQKKEVDEQKFTQGVSLLLWGYFKKVVLADNLIVFYQAIYSDPAAHSSDALVFATILMTFVYYFDFSGYCDIAVGISRLLGIRLSRNFRLPYLSQSMGEVWKRWHITLSQWINDYLNFYLLRRSFLKNKPWLVLLLCFGLLGFWHGSNWNFFFFGFFHGVAVICDRFFVKSLAPFFNTHKITKLIFKLFNIFKVFLVWNLVGVFLISKNLSQALEVFIKVFWNTDYRLADESFNFYHVLINQGIDLQAGGFPLIALFGVICLIIEIVFEPIKLIKKGYLWCWIFFLLLICMTFASYQEVEFLYFRF